MRKIVFLGVLALVVLLGGCLRSTDKSAEVSRECADLCEQANLVCSDLSVSDCQSACLNWNEETKNKIEQASSCQQLQQLSGDFIDLIPEIGEPSLISSTNDCESACANYVLRCLTLVPNATQALFDEGMMSCVAECAKWSGPKTDCMIQALNCESMTDVCGL